MLAAPAWRGEDRLAALLSDWQATTPPRRARACTCSPTRASTAVPAELEARVLRPPPTGLELEDCADINVLMEPLTPERDSRLFAAMSAYVALHDGCDGHERMARAAGNVVLRAGADTLRTVLGSAS